MFFVSTSRSFILLYSAGTVKLSLSWRWRRIRGGKLQLLTFLTSAQYGDGWSASRACHFISGIQWTEGSMGPTAGLDALGVQKNFLALTGIKPQFVGRPIRSYSSSNLCSYIVRTNINLNFFGVVTYILLHHNWIILPNETLRSRKIRNTFSGSITLPQGISLYGSETWSLTLSETQ